MFSIKTALWMFQEPSFLIQYLASLPLLYVVIIKYAILIMRTETKRYYILEAEVGFIFEWLRNLSAIL